MLEMPCLPRARLWRTVEAMRSLSGLSISTTGSRPPVDSRMSAFSSITRQRWKPSTMIQRSVASSRIVTTGWV
jgi:hypothetical protein